MFEHGAHTGAAIRLPQATQQVTHKKQNNILTDFVAGCGAGHFFGSPSSLWKRFAILALAFFYLLIFPFFLAFSVSLILYLQLNEIASREQADFSCRRFTLRRPREAWIDLPKWNLVISVFSGGTSPD